MTIHVTELPEYTQDEPRGTGCLRTERGNLPLHALDVRTAITGLVARTVLTQGFRNPFDEPLEATYVFPLPDRGAVTAMTMTADGRTITAQLQERASARQAYDDAIAAGHRASIAEEDRPDVFTMRVGNIAAGERIEVSLTVVAPLPYEDGEATYRFPLVVAPRFIPGAPLGGPQAGDGYAPDTDATPDASRITPPVLLPGFPNPVALSIEVQLDPAGLSLDEVRSSLHTITSDGGVVRVQPGERVNRDFVLRLRYADSSSSLVVCPDPEGGEGTFELTVIPPSVPATARPKDVVLLLDRSGSMRGWKMVAARRAAARIVDTLLAHDRFAVLTFDDHVESPDGLPHGLVTATDRHRYLAVECLARTDARGGTVLLEPLQRALAVLGEENGERDRVLVLVTDGQVGNEDQIIDAATPLLHGVRVHTVGIDQAVNAGFLGRLASLGGGRCELVESEDRLDAAMDAIHRRIAAPLVRELRLVRDAESVSSVSPARLPDLFPGVPLVVRGRYRGAVPSVALAGMGHDGTTWEATPAAVTSADEAITQVWARAALRDLEDAYVAAPADALEQRIVATSLRFGVLCRFTAYVAVDSRVSVEGGDLHRVIQPVELPAGWQPPMVFAAAAPMEAMSMAAGWAPQAAPRETRGRKSMKASKAGPARPVSTAFRAPAPREAMPAPRDELAEARVQAAEEARRLETMPVTDGARSDVLEDLLTRLEALLRHLDAVGVVAGELRAIVKLLRDHTVLTAERWERTYAALKEFARPEHSRAFWKRR